MKLSIFLTVLMLASASCKRSAEQAISFTDRQMVFAPDLASTPNTTKATATPAQTKSLTNLNSQTLGLYVNMATDALAASGNVYDNVSCALNASGANPTLSQNMYYPSRQDNISVYSYRPYNASTNPTNIAWTVSATQTATTINDEDFLFGKNTTVTVPKDNDAQTPIALQLQHALTLVQFEITLPVQFIDKKIKTIKSVALLNTVRTSKINVAAQTITVDGTTTSPITACYLGVTGTTSKTYTYEALVVPQTISANSRIVRIEVEYDDNSTDLFNYTASAATTFATSTYHKMTLKLDDYGQLSMTSTEIQDWATASANGMLVGNTGTGNSFIFRMINPTINYATTGTISRARMTVNGTVYTFSNTRRPTVTANGAAVDVAFAFPDDGGTRPPSYPYRIEALEFLDAGGVVLTSKRYAYDVLDEGALVIPWFDYSAVNPTITATDWTNSTGNMYLPVDNTFRLNLGLASIANSRADQITRMDLQIGGTWIQFNGFTMSAGAFTSSSTNALALTGGGIPTGYPYVITGVRIFRGATQIGGVRACNLTINNTGEWAITAWF